MLKIKIKKLKSSINSNKNAKNKKPKNIFGQMLNIFLFLMILIFTYSVLNKYLLQDIKRKEVEVPMNEIVKNINLTDQTSSSTFKNILVSEDNVSLEVGTDTLFVAKKETNESFLSVLKNYGVSTDTINHLNIKVSNESSFSFWTNILPIFLPIIFLAAMLWMLLRGVKGANMQALSFGQTRAKLIDPNDT